MFGLIKRILTQNFYNKKAPEAFQHFYKYSSESKTYLSYCNMVHNLDIPVQNNTSPEQLERLTTELSQAAPKNVLDLGCGTGHLLRYYQDKFGFNAKGIDFALAQSKGNLIKGNFEDHVFEDGEFDFIYSIDSLYMMNNLKKVLNKYLKFLKSNGTFFIFYTSTEVFERSPMAKALNKLGVNFEIEEMTENDKLFWERSSEILKNLKKDFFEEGNVSVWKTKTSEADKNIELHKRNSLFRYIIKIKKS